jgi:hypothetical protein
MKKIFQAGLLIGALSLVILAACGGGGGGGGAPQPKQPTTAVLTLTTALIGALPADTIVAGYDVWVTLPEGVTVRSIANPPQTDTGVVTPTDASTSVTAVYQPASGGNPARVHIIAATANANGFAPGAFSDVHCNITAGSYPQASSFPQPTFEASFFDIVSQSTNTTLVSGQVLSMTATAVVN